MRDRIFAEMTPEWKDAYEAGIFTEFMEQRAPGHTVLGDIIYRKGLLDLKREVAESIARLDFFNDPRAYDKQQQLRAMSIAADAVIRFAERHAEKAESLSGAETNPRRKAELDRIAAVCRHVPAHAPRNFWEAIQAYWFTHLSVITELNTWDSFSPGHLDQHLYPFYRRDLDAATLTREEARELLGCFWVKFNNQPAPPKVGVTAVRVGKWGYVDVAGKMAINPQFDDADEFSEGLAAVRLGGGVPKPFRGLGGGGRYGYIHRDGKYVINPQFDEAGKFAAGLAAVKLGGRWGFIGKTGNFVINPQFDEAAAFSS